MGGLYERYIGVDKENVFLVFMHLKLVEIFVLVWSMILLRIIMSRNVSDYVYFIIKYLKKRKLGLL